jgi:hypothetical protein
VPELIASVVYTLEVAIERSVPSSLNVFLLDFSKSNDVYLIGFSLVSTHKSMASRLSQICTIGDGEISPYITPRPSLIPCK